MKKIIAIIALCAMLTASACSGNSEPAKTTAVTTTADKSSTKTQVAYKAEDTTDEALEIIAEKSPLYYRYLKTRMTAPLTILTSQNVNGTEQTYGLYIKNETESASYSIIDGNKIRLIYNGDKAYQVEDNNKQVYVIEYGEDNVKSAVEQNLIRISASEARNAEFTQDVREYEGVQYDCVSISMNGEVASTVYFEHGTEKLCYMQSGEVMTKVFEFSASVTDESVFDIPDDYKRLTFDDLVKSINEEQAQ